MKLSEAIERGSHILQPSAGRFISPDEHSGCALGMAAVAQCLQHDDAFLLGISLGKIWPILSQMVEMPCDCFGTHVSATLYPTITHLFDHHVMYGPSMTLEELIAFVARIEAQHEIPVEPAEPEVVEVEELQCV